MINSQYYFDGSLVTDEVAAQDEWLDEQLVTAKTATHAVRNDCCCFVTMKSFKRYKILVHKLARSLKMV